MKISVAIIGKNEEKAILGCLKSVKEADEILYLDTGSTDDTLKEVKKYKGKNLRILPAYQWREDFSHARNTCTQYAANEWVLTIDCDERLKSGGIAKIKRLLSQYSEQGGFNGLKITVNLPHEKAFQLRVHRKDNYWHRPAHNKLSIINGFRETDIEIDAGTGSHHTYDPTMRKRIISRYLNQAGNTTDAEMWYYLGREYYKMGDLLGAINCFEKCKRFTYLNYTDIYIDGMFMLAQSHYLMNNVDEARQSLAEAISLNPNFGVAVELMSRINPSWTPFFFLANDENVLIRRSSLSIMDERNISKRVAQLATIPTRQGTLKKCLDSITPFVDEVRVMLNNYSTIPMWLKEMPKVVPVRRNNERGDAEKFYDVEKLENCIIFILDDDTIYNEVFFNSCHDATIRHRCPVSYHGKKMAKNVKSYIDGADFTFDRYESVIGHSYVDIMGTNSLCFTSDLEISYGDFKSANVSDIWFSYFCRMNKIPMLTLPHYKLEYIKQKEGTTITENETRKQQTTDLYKKLFEK